MRLTMTLLRNRSPFHSPVNYRGTVIGHLYAAEDGFLRYSKGAEPLPEVIRRQIAEYWRMCWDG